MVALVSASGDTGPADSRSVDSLVPRVNTNNPRARSRLGVEHGGYLSFLEHERLPDADDFQ